MDCVTDDRWKPLVSFHGHMCPGLAVGARAVTVGLRELAADSPPQPLWVLAETAMCSVDAVQHLTGCTLGNGGLVFRDHGKNAFTFIGGPDDRAVRVVAKPDALPPDPEHARLRHRADAGVATEVERARYAELHLARAQMILDVPEARLFSVLSDGVAPLKLAERSQEAEPCSLCGEMVMRTRSIETEHGTRCIPCAGARGTG